MKIQPYQEQIAKKLTIFGSSFSTHGFLVIKEQLFGFGRNDCHQIGLQADNQNKPNLTKLTFFTSKNVVKACCGHLFSYFIEQGKGNVVFCCGKNSYGVLGLKNINIIQKSPSRVSVFNNNKKVEIIDIFVGYYQSYFLSKSLECFGSGYNYFGSLGLGDINSRSVATKIPLKEKIISISCGVYHTFFVSISGSIYGTGYNSEGALGIGKRTNVISPIKISFFEGKKIIAAFCGNYNSFFLTYDNQLFAFGRNYGSNLGIEEKGNKTSPVLVSKLSNEKIISVQSSEFTAFECENKYGLCGNLHKLGFSNKHSPDEVFSIDKKKKKIVQSLMFSYSMIYFTEDDEIWGHGENKFGELINGKIGKTKISRSCILPGKIKENKVQIISFRKVNFVEDKAKILEYIKRKTKEFNELKSTLNSFEQTESKLLETKEFIKNQNHDFSSSVPKVDIILKSLKEIISRNRELCKEFCRKKRNLEDCFNRDYELFIRKTKDFLSCIDCSFKNLGNITKKEFIELYSRKVEIVNISKTIISFDPFFKKIVDYCVEFIKELQQNESYIFSQSGFKEAVRKFELFKKYQEERKLLIKKGVKSSWRDLTKKCNEIFIEIIKFKTPIEKFQNLFGVELFNFNLDFEKELEEFNKFDGYLENIVVYFQKLAVSIKKYDEEGRKDNLDLIQAIYNNEKLINKEKYQFFKEEINKMKKNLDLEKVEKLLNFKWSEYVENQLKLKKRRGLGRDILNDELPYELYGEWENKVVFMIENSELHTERKDLTSKRTTKGE